MKKFLLLAFVLSCGAGATPIGDSPWLECTKTPEYRAYKIQFDVISPRDMIPYLQKELAQERKISAISGVRNLSKEYDIGKQMVQAKDDLAYFWDVYKEAGGKAKKPSDLPKELDDPCYGL